MIPIGSAVKITSHLDKTENFNNAVGIVLDKVEFASPGDSDYYMDLERGDGVAYLVFVNGEKQTFFEAELRVVSENS
tara:strand:- start:2159 stop:2389 length:231 start_codon:yes stop_codon:yes gene_type:complete